MADQRFLPEYRLRRPADFDRVYRRRVSASDGRLIVYVADNALDHPRVGLSVSRKVGGAVVRNRCRRLFREAFRLSREALPQQVDLVLIPKPGWQDGLGPLRESLIELANRAARRLQKRS